MHPQFAIRARSALVSIRAAPLPDPLIQRKPVGHLAGAVPSRHELFFPPRAAQLESHPRRNNPASEIAASARQYAIACAGNPAQCLMRRKRSSSAAATSVPSRTMAADESPWKQLRPRMIMGRVEQEQLAQGYSRTPPLSRAPAPRKRRLISSSAIMHSASTRCSA